MAAARCTRPGRPLIVTTAKLLAAPLATKDEMNRASKLVPML